MWVSRTALPRSQGAQPLCKVEEIQHVPVQLGVFSLEMCSRHHFPHDEGNFNCNLHKCLQNRSQDSFRQIQLLVFMQKVPVLFHALGFNLHNILAGRNSVCNYQSIKATSFTVTRPYPPVFEHTPKTTLLLWRPREGDSLPWDMVLSAISKLFQEPWVREDLVVLLIKVDRVKKVLIRRVKFLTQLRHPGKCIATFLFPLPANILNVGNLSSYVGQHNVTFHFPVYRDNAVS